MVVQRLVDDVSGLLIELFLLLFPTANALFVQLKRAYEAMSREQANIDSSCFLSLTRPRFQYQM
jgi:hypothetical protein